MYRYQITKFYIPVSLGLISIIVLIFLIFKVENNDIKIVKIGNNFESCLGCHENVTGFSDAHNPSALGCATCHLGNPFSSDTVAAHDNLVLIPGNISDAPKTCGKTDCHPEISKNIKNSLMTTSRGIVSVNRFVFGESASPDGNGSFSELGHSPADQHMRNLCASCHLSNEKTNSAPLTELSRGGGCLACHLQYSDEAEEQLTAYQNKKVLPTIHPSITIKVTNDHCFGCHSRSGRISTNYEGWHETLLDSIPVNEEKNFSQTMNPKFLSQYRELEDGRIFSKQIADVHFEKGLECIDCHTWRETMGDGNIYYHEEEQIEISCKDCHFAAIPKLKNKSKLESIDLKILNQRGWSDNDLQFVITRKSSQALLNVQINQKNKPFLIGKNSGKIFQLKSPLSICTKDIKGHNRLTCQSCHSAWAPQCLGCHTQFNSGIEVYDHLEKKNIKGGWRELSSDFYAEPPTLGIQIQDGKEIVDTFIPGMIFTIIHKNGENVFRRLYAPSSSHTTVTKARDCKSCHINPVAIGFGRGNLSFEKIDNNKAIWNFTPKYAINPNDNLPEDAWTGFLKTRTGMVSTRVGARPFNKSEQQKILKVGVCLSCHKSNSQNLKEIYFNFEAAVSNLSAACIE